VAVELSSTLTTREEVAAFVVQGISNCQITSDLILSERTKENHVSKIPRKLALASRIEIASWGTRQRLIALEPD
jgi:non-specific serine/threonine protein kinase